MEQNSIFRKKSIDRVTAPEELDDYIKVTRPSIWIILCSIAMLLIGVTIWGVFGHLDTTLDVLAVSDGSRAVIYVSEKNIENIEPGTQVEADGNILTTAAVSPRPQQLDDEYLRHVAGLSESDWVYTVELNGSLPEGIYSAKAVIDSVKPISFVVG